MSGWIVKSEDRCQGAEESPGSVSSHWNNLLHILSAEIGMVVYKLLKRLNYWQATSFVASCELQYATRNNAASNYRFNKLRLKRMPYETQKLGPRWSRFRLQFVLDGAGSPNFSNSRVLMQHTIFRYSVGNWNAANAASTAFCKPQRISPIPTSYASPISPLNTRYGNQNCPRSQICA